jgi:hypothetical protein
MKSMSSVGMARVLTGTDMHLQRFGQKSNMIRLFSKRITVAEVLCAWEER